MNTQLKKGDKIASQWGVLTLNEDKGKGDFVSVITESGEVKLMRTKELDRLLTNSQPQPDMSLKKGDKCQIPWGIVTVHEVLHGSDIVTVDVEGMDGIYRMVHRDELTRIPSFEEEMQAVINIAMDVENRLEDDETVQLKVGQFVKFVRHYCALKAELEQCAEYHETQSKENLAIARDAEKILKGETTI